MIEERWKFIENYPDYEVSDKGKVRSYKRGWLHFLKLIKDQGGYFHVTLYNDKSYKTFRIHRLVLEAFIGYASNNYEANHKDGDKENNNFTNLEWVTSQENKEHAVKMGLRSKKAVVGEKTSSAKLKDGEVWLIKKLLYHNIKVGFISKMFKVSYSTIDAIKRGWYWKHVVYP